MGLATTTTAASGRCREELLGQRPARRKCRPRHARMLGAATRGTKQQPTGLIAYPAAQGRAVRFPYGLHETATTLDIPSRWDPRANQSPTGALVAVLRTAALSRVVVPSVCFTPWSGVRIPLTTAPASLPCTPLFVAMRHLPPTGGSLCSLAAVSSTAIPVRVKLKIPRANAAAATTLDIPTGWDLQQRRPRPVADAGRSCWGSGQQDASAAQGTRGCWEPQPGALSNSPLG